MIFNKAWVQKFPKIALQATRLNKYVLSLKSRNKIKNGKQAIKLLSPCAMVLFLSSMSFDMVAA